MKALEESGIIKGYHAVIDPLASPEMMPFVINLETKPENFDEARAYFANAEDTIMLIQTTGRCHLLAICVARDGTAMRNWINSAYRTLPGIETINVHSVLEMIKGRIIPE